MAYSITPRHCSSGTDAMLKFITGGVDVAYMGAVPYALAKMYGMPLVAVQASGRWSEAVCIAERAERLGEPVRIATVQGSNAHLLAWYWARSIDRDVLFLDLDPEDQLVALETGLVDGISTWEPYVSRALSSSVRMAYSSADLPFQATDLLVCSDRALAEGGHLVDKLQSVHRSAVNALVSGLDERTRVTLASLLGLDIYSTWLGELPFPAPRAFLEKEPNALDAMTRSVQEFLVESGLAAGLRAELGDGWAMIDQEGASSLDSLVVGYSSDIMCAPFYLAQFTNAFEDVGISVNVPKDLFAERMARLSGPAHEELQGVQALLSSDSELALMKIGRIMERELTELHSSVFSTSAPKRISATIAELEESEVLPPLMASSADWIRRMRNVATHGSGTSSDTARKAFSELLEYLEWAVMAKSELLPRCGRCKATIEPSWRRCPACTAELKQSCATCGRELKSGWKLCPDCG